jgi:hypothetical protein
MAKIEQYVSKTIREQLETLLNQMPLLPEAKKE